LLPYCVALNSGMLGYSLAKRERWLAVWSGFWMLACLVAA
jgi:hypothetical protein